MSLIEVRLDFVFNAPGPSLALYQPPAMSGTSISTSTVGAGRRFADELAGLDQNARRCQRSLETIQADMAALAAARPAAVSTTGSLRAALTQQLADLEAEQAANEQLRGRLAAEEQVAAAEAERLRRV
eukprot:SAG22_NODE_8776_length_630_cov_1.828625_1_plen_127_part_10